MKKLAYGLIAIGFLSLLLVVPQIAFLWFIGVQEVPEWLMTALDYYAWAVATAFAVGFLISKFTKQSSSPAL